MSAKIEDGPRAEHVADREAVSTQDGDISRLSLHQLTAEELAVEKKLRWRIDLRIMPLTVLVYLMNYIDR